MLLKGIRTILLTRKEVKEKGAIYRNGDWLTRVSRNCDDEVQIPYDYTIETSILERRTTDYAHLTMRKNAYLKKLEKGGHYNWHNMLVITNPYNKSPLTALLIFSTHRLSKVRYRVIGQCDYCAESSLCYQHRVAVYGLYAGRRNRVELTLLDAKDQLIAKKDIYITTEALPEELKRAIVVRKKTDVSIFPFVMISGGHDITTCAFDQKGKIRFYLQKKSKAYGIFPMSGGRFLYTEKYISIPSYFIPQGAQYYDMDYLGGVKKTYYTPNGIHHCAKELCPGGNYIMASSSFNGSVENAIVEVDRSTGKILKMLVVDQLFDNVYRDRKDWCHINSIDYDPDDQSVLVSLRNIHAVIKISWVNMSLTWILSNPELWVKTSMMNKVLQPTGEIDWFYQQHSAYETESMEEGMHRIVLYDNHWDKRRPVVGHNLNEEHSYVKVFDIDEKNMCVQQVHEVAVPKSIIRSNAIVKERYNRLFHMSAELLHPIDGCKGLIEECNYESGEIINSYLVRPGFFTAYPFQPNAGVLEETQLVENDYIVGDTIPVAEMPMPDNFWNDLREDADIEKFYFNEEVLYVKGEDHEVSRIAFVGKNKYYEIKIMERIREKEKIIDSCYAIPIKVNMLDFDTYDIYYHTAKGNYKIKDAFTIRKADL